MKSIVSKIILVLSVILLIGTIINSVNDYLTKKEAIENIQYRLTQKFNKHLNFLLEEEKKQLKKNFLKIIQILKQSIANDLYNYAIEELKNDVSAVFEIPYVKAIKIVDLTTNSIILSAYKNKKLHYNHIPEDYKGYQALYVKLFANNQHIGNLIVYYKINTKNLISSFTNTSIKPDLNTLTISILTKIVFLLAMISIVMFLMYLFIKKPLVILKFNLNEFFSYLKNPKQIKLISINTQDEFETFNKWIEENIQITSQMHKDINYLLRLVNENIGILNLDENKKITKKTIALQKIATQKEIEEILKENILDTNRTIQCCVCLKSKVFEILSSPKCIDEENCGWSLIIKDITKEKEIYNLKENLEKIVKQRTKELSEINYKMKKAIEYGSLIQSAIIPKKYSLQNCFKDYFVLWMPKDIVSGDIWFFEQIDKNRCVLMMFDCTGHGVSGAFITMLVKAIEIKLLEVIKNKTAAEILEFFNQELKNIWDNYDKNIIDVGFDGSVIVINKEEKIIEYAGAKSELYYIEGDEVKVIKPTKASIGYKTTDYDQKYKLHKIPYENKKFFLTTDGFIDQTGGKKEFSFGKKRFKKLLLEYKNEPMAEIETILMYELMNYQGKHERNDDITVIGFEI